MTKSDFIEDLSILIQEIPEEARIPLLIFISLLLGFCFALFVRKLISPGNVKSSKNDPSNIAKNELHNHSNMTLSVVDEIKAETNVTWLARLNQGLSKTRSYFNDNLKQIFSNSKLSSEKLDQLHEMLYRADVGQETADYLTESVKKHFTGKSDEDADWSSISSHLKNSVAEILSLPKTNENMTQEYEGLKVILVVGVNGVGKTTSIGKLAARYIAKDKKVVLCAADTFRAAAIDQLKVWGERLNVPVVHHQEGSDPAAVAYDGVKSAMSRNADFLIIDTAGRLHNKLELMDELDKIKRVIGKDLTGAPHETFLVIDATTGQNAFQQIKAFKSVVNLTGLIVTKLDGTAKGGIIIGATKQFNLPIKYIGVGEKASDLRPFSAKDYAESLF